MDLELRRRLDRVVHAAMLYARMIQTCQPGAIGTSELEMAEQDLISAKDSVRAHFEHESRMAMERAARELAFERKP